MPLVRGASRRGVGRRARFMQALCKHGATPRTKSTSLCTLYQAERRLFVDWEGSQATQALPLRWQSLVQREVALCLIRRAPLVIGAQSDV